MGSKFAACMWLFTDAVQCDGQGSTESVRWVCEDALWEHEWVTELNVLLKENEILEALHYDLDVPCSIQWRLLWFSPPSRLRFESRTGEPAEEPEEHKRRETIISFDLFAMWETLPNNAGWDCFKTPILQKILRIQSLLRVEHCAFLEVIHLFQ